MNRLIELRRKYLVVSDIVIAIVLGVLLHWLSSLAEIDTDLVAMLVGVISVIGLGAYLALVAVFDKKPQLQRFKNSIQFKNVLTILYGYMFFVAVSLVVQAFVSLGWAANYVVAAYAVLLWRTGWIFYRTIRLF